jgi:hypothetical protein
MPEADSEHGDFAREVFDGFGRDAAVFERFAWTWGDDEVVGLRAMSSFSEIWSLR